MKEYVLVIIKPDGIAKALVGNILMKFSNADLDIGAIKLLTVTEEIAKEHYKHIKGKPFYKEVISYLIGALHGQNKVLALVFSGKNAIQKSRNVAGDTNPEVAHPHSIRGSFGRITSKGVFENIVHVSSDKKEAEREIKLWFSPDEFDDAVFPTKEVSIKNYKKQTWA